MDQLLNYPTASLSVDLTSRFMLIQWHGRVSFEDYEAVLTMAAEIAEVHEIYQVIVDRRGLTELSAECRVWTKNHFFKELIRPIIPELTKVATIEDRSAIGLVYAKAISNTVALLYPNFNFRSFTTSSAAIRWINPNTAHNSHELQSVAIAAGASTTSERRAPLNTVTATPSEARSEHLIQSLYQLFFANR